MFITTELPDNGKHINTSEAHCCGIILSGGEISKMYTCPRTSGLNKTLVRTIALFVPTSINTNASISK